MTTQHDLDNAILSMHAYNVGAKSHLLDSVIDGYNEPGERIGQFTINNFRETGTGFAATYFESADTFVLSFRGTNINGLYEDATNGWSLGLGNSTTAVGQVADAIAYYDDLTNANGGLRFQSGPIEVTGHSLGGGLAGYIAGAYNIQGTLFNYMPFSRSLASDFADNNPILAHAAAQPSYDNITAVNTLGEILGSYRPIDYAYDDTQSQTVASYYNSSFNPLLTHSIALEVALIWSDLNVDRAWSNAATPLFDAFFDSALAVRNSKVAASIGPDGSAATSVDEAIAYSAIATGAKPFGDTAIYAMFDDAADLHMALNAVSVPAALSRATPLLGSLTIDFATRLAFEHVFDASPTDAADLSHAYVVDPTARAGVLHLSSDQSVLSVDFGTDRWSIGTADDQSYVRSQLIDSVFANTSDRSDFDTLLAFHSFIGSQQTSVSSVSFQIGGPNQFTPAVTNQQENGFDLVVLRYNDAFIASLSDGRDDLILGSPFVDRILGGSDSDIIIGGDGDDILVGGDGHDFIAGGAGNDLIQGGAGPNEYLYGGAGNDIIFAEGLFQNLVGGAGDDTIVITAAAGDASIQIEGSDTIMILASPGTNRTIMIEMGSDLTGQIVFNGRTLGHVDPYIVDMTVDNDGSLQSYYIDWSDQYGTSYQLISNTYEYEDGTSEQHQDLQIEFGDGTHIYISDFYNGAMGIEFSDISPYQIVQDPNSDVESLPRFSTYNDGILQGFMGDIQSQEAYLAYTTMGSVIPPMAAV